MTMKATFQNTVDILVKAYLNGTLVHGECAACAVGNIIAANIGAQVDVSDLPYGADWKRDGQFLIVGWNEVFVTRHDTQHVNPKQYLGQIKRQIDASGYSWQDLAKIEYAFETAPRNCVIEDQLNEEWMFNGLMAVVDVLAEIHGIDLQQKETAKGLFVKVPL